MVASAVLLAVVTPVALCMGLVAAIRWWVQERRWGPARREARRREFEPGDGGTGPGVSTVVVPSQGYAMSVSVSDLAKAAGLTLSQEGGFTGYPVWMGETSDLMRFAALVEEQTIVRCANAGCECYGALPLESLPRLYGPQPLKQNRCVYCGAMIPDGDVWCDACWLEGPADERDDWWPLPVNLEPEDTEPPTPKNAEGL